MFLSVPGNHDYWLCGDENCYDASNGFMQFYGQDAYASSSTFPYNFTIDPDTPGQNESNLRSPSGNFHVAYNIGNIGVIGYTGG